MADRRGPLLTRRAFFTWYACPNENCNFTTKLPRPEAQARLNRQRRPQAVDLSVR
jgi:hypothetical protein